jgi:peptidyl-dipeptidase A
VVQHTDKTKENSLPPITTAAALAGMSALTLLCCASPAHAHARPPSVAEAEKFISQAEQRLEKLGNAEQRTAWVYQTHITSDTEAISVQANEQLLAATGEIAVQARRYKNLPLSPPNRRKLTLLQLHLSLAKSEDRQNYAQLTAALTGAYSKATYCREQDGKRTCLNLGQLEAIMAKSRNAAELKEIWLGWHQQAPAYKDLYARYVAVSNQGAREMGFADTGALWRSQYDMPPEAFAAESERLWQQVKPLYDALHQYVRLKLQQTYGKDEVPGSGPVPAHLFGNMWSQSWDNLYPLVQPPGPAANLDIAEKLAPLDAQAMVRMGEAFYTSLGMEALPPSFWEKSLFTKPRDREVVCHASAWDMGRNTENTANRAKDGIDVRIKMCINPTSEDFAVIHHELGHIYYDMAYRKQPWLFRAGANEGFHEAIGDTVTLSVTPRYLHQLGLLPKVPDETQEIGVLLNRALQNVAFLPFGYLVDQWRWEVYSGRTKPQDYDKLWWQLREKYQGIKRPAALLADGFDAGAKYHVAADSSYAKYFVAAILQFQLHRALCRQANDNGPLHRCSIYQNRAAGEKFQAMLKQGSSAPWQEVLKTVAGEDKLDASAIIDYFAPLKVWLDAQNEALGKR